MSCVAFSAACCCRLARFNLKAQQNFQLERISVTYISEPLPLQDREKPMEVFDPAPLRSQFYKRRMYFEGIPAPVGAAYALLPMMTSFMSTTMHISSSIATWAASCSAKSGAVAMNQGRCSGCCCCCCCPTMHLCTLERRSFGRPLPLTAAVAAAERVAVRIRQDIHTTG